MSRARGEGSVGAGLYPPVGFHFKVEFQLTSVQAQDREVRFQDVAGFVKELSMEEFSEGGENGYIHRFPGPAKYSNLVLKRGVLRGSALIQWCFDAIDNFIFDPATVIATLLDENHLPIIAWIFERAYPVKWGTSDLKAEKSAVLVETLELAYTKFTKQDV